MVKVNKSLFFLILFLLSFTFLYTKKAYADESDTSSMGWLTMKSLQTPVGTDQITTQSETFPEAHPIALSIPALSQISFQYPLLVRPRITTYFSSRHPGTDFAVPLGSQIIAAESGIVTEAGWSTQGYGNTIVLHHAQNVYTRYAHLSVLSVTVGQYVMKSAPLGLVGCTGRCTGPHLHFEIHMDNHFIDPLSAVSY